MWTVIGPQSDSGPTQAEDDISHAFLILSQKDSTMILQTGQEINEVDHSGFNTQGPTIFAGNLASNKYIVQVGDEYFFNLFLKSKNILLRLSFFRFQKLESDCLEDWNKFNIYHWIWDRR